MRDIILLIAIPLGLAYGLTSASRSVLVLNWLWFQRPYSFAYDFWSRIPIFQIAVAATLISNIARGALRPKGSLILLVYILLLIWLTLSAILAFSPPVAWEFYKEFLPSMIVSPILMYATINDLDLLKKVLWVSAGGIGLNAFKVGLAMTARGGGVLSTQIAGFVGDNNVFGLTLCLVVPILIGLRSTVPNKRWMKISFVVFLLFICLCIIYTRSRGAQLTLLIILLCRALFSERKVRNVAIVLLAVLGTFLLVPEHYFNRLHTLDDLQANASFMGRLQNWELSWNEALRYPLFGVGPGNHLIYNESRPHTVTVRVAHSVYFQTLGELGFPALFLYLLFLILTLKMLFRTRKYAIRLAAEYPDLSWVRDVASWMICGYIGYIVGSAFLNMFYIEFPWYLPFYGSMLMPLSISEANRRVALST